LTLIDSTLAIKFNKPMSVNGDKGNIIEDRISGYRHRESSSRTKLDVHALNRRLNEDKKIDFFRNIRLIFISLSALAIIMLISFKF